MPPVKPLPYDFSVHSFEHSSVYGVEKLSGILARFQLQDDLFDNKQEYTKKFDERKNRISNIINNNILGGEFSLVISEEYWEGYDDYGVDVIERTETVRCIRLDEFAAWVKRQKNFKCPQEILDKASEGSGNKNSTPATDNTKIVDGLLKMVIAMAIDCYGHDPKIKKNTTVSDINIALQKCGLSLSEGTIRKRLEQAQSYLPPQDHEQEKTQ
jgi:hypothetical protein